jgi:hypothetical protein
LHDLFGLAGDNSAAFVLSLVNSDKRSSPPDHDRGSRSITVAKVNSLVNKVHTTSPDLQEGDQERTRAILSAVRQHPRIAGFSRGHGIAIQGPGGAARPRRIGREIPGCVWRKNSFARPSVVGIPSRHSQPGSRVKLLSIVARIVMTDCATDRLRARASRQL